MDSGSPLARDLRAENLRILGELLRDCCEELMADYGVGADPHTWRHSATGVKPALGAAISFGGIQLGGCLALTATQGVIAATVGVLPGADAARERVLADWVCELANQLLGRMKNKLRGYDVSLDMALPRLRDTSCAPEPAHDVCHRFACEHGLFSGYLDVRIQPGLALTACALDSEQPSEGEMLLF